MTTAERMILHIVPHDLARGAQRYAQELVDFLQGRNGLSHRLLTLFDAEHVVLRPDLTLGVPRGPLRRLGLDPRVIARLRGAVADLDPDLVVAHGGESAKYAALAVPKSLPLVYLKIGTGAESLRRRGFRSLLNAYYTKRADVVAGVSSDVVEDVATTLDISMDRLMVIPNARDPEGFDPAQVGVAEEPVAIFVGHLNPGKRPDWFITAVHRLRERGTSLRAVMVGDGPLEEELKGAASAAAVEMLGKRDDVPALLAASDIFVFTSLPPGEGMPGVLIEAGLAGLATVATDVPGARDVVEDGITGLVVDIDDQVGLVEALDRLARDRELRVAMGARARERCLERFTFEATARLWLEVFDRLGVGGGAEVGT